MPDGRVLVLAPALDAAECEAGLQRLAKAAIPKAVQYVVTTGKFDTRGLAKSFNVETGYPAEPAHLQTLAAWAEVPHRSDRRFTDGYALFCLRVLFARDDGFSRAVILRQDSAIADWPQLQAQCEGRLFLTFDQRGFISSEPTGRRNLLFNVADPRFSRLLDCVLQLYFSGAVYGFQHYAIDAALAAAVEALEFEQAACAWANSCSAAALGPDGGDVI